MHLTHVLSRITLIETTESESGLVELVVTAFGSTFVWT